MGGGGAMRTDGISLLVDISLPKELRYAFSSAVLVHVGFASRLSFKPIIRPLI